MGAGNRDPSYLFGQESVSQLEEIFQLAPSIPVHHFFLQFGSSNKINPLTFHADVEKGWIRIRNMISTEFPRSKIRTRTHFNFLNLRRIRESAGSGSGFRFLAVSGSGSV